MKIGIDLDDTLTDIQDEWRKLAVKYDKTLRGKGIVNFDKALLGEKFDWSSEERDYFLKNYRLEVVKKARLRINALETLNELKRRGYEIVIITARSDKYYSDPYQISYDYLVQKKIPFDKLIVNSLDKRKVCEEENISYFIDDNLANCLNVATLNIKVFCLDIGLYKSISSEVIKISDLKELLEYIR